MKGFMNPSPKGHNKVAIPLQPGISSNQTFRVHTNLYSFAAI